MRMRKGSPGLRNPDFPCAPACRGAVSVGPPVYHLLTLRFPLRGMCVKKAWSSESGGLMMNEAAERVWGAGLSMLSPAWLIDRLLDAVENLRVVPMPAHAGGLSCNEMQFETDLDQVGA